MTEIAKQEIRKDCFFSRKFSPTCASRAVAKMRWQGSWERFLSQEDLTNYEAFSVLWDLKAYIQEMENK